MDPTWQLSECEATIVQDRANGSVDLQRPEAGIQKLAVDGNAIDGALLGVTIANASDTATATTTEQPWQVQDAYIRGPDLVAVYKPQPSRPFRWQVYWRLIKPTDAALAAVDLIVSLQTPLLDAYPVVTVTSQFNGQQVRMLDKSGHEMGTQNDANVGEGFRLVLVKCAGNLSIAEMVHPVDYSGFRLRCDEGQIRTEWPMGEHFMEKGVIRRMRMRAAILPAGAETEVARQQLADLATAAPPLTT